MGHHCSLHPCGSRSEVTLADQHPPYVTRRSTLPRRCYSEGFRPRLPDGGSDGLLGRVNMMWAPESILCRRKPIVFLSESTWVGGLRQRESTAVQDLKEFIVITDWGPATYLHLQHAGLRGINLPRGRVTAPSCQAASRRRESCAFLAFPAHCSKARARKSAFGCRHFPGQALVSVLLLHGHNQSGVHDQTSRCNARAGDSEVG
jgi:hypothetical protein